MRACMGARPYLFASSGGLMSTPTRLPHPLACRCGLLQRRRRREQLPCPGSAWLLRGGRRQCADPVCGWQLRRRRRARRLQAMPTARILPGWSCVAVAVPCGLLLPRQHDGGSLVAVPGVDLLQRIGLGRCHRLHGLRPRLLLRVGGPHRAVGPLRGGLRLLWRRLDRHAHRRRHRRHGRARHLRTGRRRSGDGMPRRHLRQRIGQHVAGRMCRLHAWLHLPARWHSHADACVRRWLCLPRW